MKSGAVQPATPPRADRLRFVGQEDVRISLGRWVATADRAFYCGLPYRDAMQREQACRRTLATDKERICEAK